MQEVLQTGFQSRAVIHWVWRVEKCGVVIDPYLVLTKVYLIMIAGDLCFLCGKGGLYVIFQGAVEKKNGWKFWHQWWSGWIIFNKQLHLLMKDSTILSLIWINGLPLYVTFAWSQICTIVSFQRGHGLCWLLCMDCCKAFGCARQRQSLRRRSVAIAAVSGNEWRANLMGATFLSTTFKSPLH